MENEKDLAIYGWIKIDEFDSQRNKFPIFVITKGEQDELNNFPSFRNHVLSFYITSSNN